MRTRHEGLGHAQVKAVDEAYHLIWPGFTLVLTREEAGWLATNLSKAISDPVKAAALAQVGRRWIDGRPVDAREVSDTRGDR